MEFYEFVLRKREEVLAIQYDGTLEYAKALSAFTDRKLWPDYRGDKFTGRLGVWVRGSRRGDPDIMQYAKALDYVVADDDTMRRFSIWIPDVFEALYGPKPRP